MGRKPKANWPMLRRRFVHGKVETLEEIALEAKVHLSTVHHRAADEEWVKARKATAEEATRRALLKFLSEDPERLVKILEAKLGAGTDMLAKARAVLNSISNQQFRPEVAAQMAIAGSALMDAPLRLAETIAKDAAEAGSGGSPHVLIHAPQASQITVQQLIAAIGKGKNPTRR